VCVQCQTTNDDNATNSHLMSLLIRVELPTYSHSFQVSVSSTGIVSDLKHEIEQMCISVLLQHPSVVATCWQHDTIWIRHRNKTKRIPGYMVSNSRKTRKRISSPPGNLYLTGTGSAAPYDLARYS